ncbi:hypothetical protein A1Q2_00247 [Trichosporon asahii var. asahii CBS 8904]|uniref:Uncharacterized protein n=1 Tax=Trichosporon asahii var. asahii (strain CBS 8904) TaxID=1220162 RepID=K1VY21_TRIAC|nr:hypothetical protein A1Q2_00247 [Trichosporon asahii var. asahii CBS 8904]
MDLARLRFGAERGAGVDRLELLPLYAIPAFRGTKEAPLRTPNTPMQGTHDVQFLGTTLGVLRHMGDRQASELAGKVSSELSARYLSPLSFTSHSSLPPYVL